MLISKLNGIQNILKIISRMIFQDNLKDGYLEWAGIVNMLKIESQFYEIKKEIVIK